VHQVHHRGLHRGHRRKSQQLAQPLLGQAAAGAERNRGFDIRRGNHHGSAVEGWTDFPPQAERQVGGIDQ
jgi:hypothetical protein